MSNFYAARISSDLDELEQVRGYLEEAQKHAHKGINEEEVDETIW